LSLYGESAITSVLKAARRAVLQGGARGASGCANGPCKMRIYFLAIAKVEDEWPCDHITEERGRDDKRTKHEAPKKIGEKDEHQPNTAMWEPKACLRLQD
jgi:hypothetical protein